ncbi:DUF4406 domain-containing protein [Georgenia sp. MJ170]|uniref:DUF4406 domain-containing protein n=1 Tax=Georgenia sunbinii TaxID=3117728 RepID=UPI002F2680E9
MKLRSGAAVYIAGPMTGLPDFNRPAFHATAALLAVFGGWRAINPARQPDGLTWEEYVRRGLADVRRADAVYLLPGWRDSRGATREVVQAFRLGLPVWDEEAGSWLTR